MNAKAERKERSHVDILASAARLVREKGIGGATVTDVMSGAGLTVGGFYAHFASKDALVDEVVRHMGELLRGRLFARLDEKPASERIAVVLARYLSTAHRDTMELGCPFPAVVGEVGTTAPAHRAVVGEQVGAFAAELEANLPRSRTKISTRHLALGLVALMYGGLSMARALRGTELSDEMLRACRALAKLASAEAAG